VRKGSSEEAAVKRSGNIETDLPKPSPLNMNGMSTQRTKILEYIFLNYKRQQARWNMKRVAGYARRTCEPLRRAKEVSMRSEIR
jgi:hypothetical protein